MSVQSALVLPFVATASIGLLMPGACHADEPHEANLTEIIGRIEENERLIQHLDVTLVCRYETPIAVEPLVQLERLWQVRCVRQAGRSLWEVAETSFTDPHVLRFEHVLYSYDGQLRRSFGYTSDDGQIAANDDLFLEHFKSPHALLVLGPDRELSPYLARVVASKEQDVVSYAGVGQFDGLDCDKLRLRRPGTSRERELWLARDRNCLPMRVQTFEAPSRPEVATVEGVVEEFRELEPGVWFPWKLRYSRYNRHHLERTGERILGWRKVTEIESVSLNPEHPVGFFRHIAEDALTLNPRYR